MDQISLITILSIAIVYFLLRPYYLKDIVNYEYKTIADLLAFLFFYFHYIGTKFIARINPSTVLTTHDRNRKARISAIVLYS